MASPTRDREEGTSRISGAEVKQDHHSQPKEAKDTTPSGDEESKDITHSTISQHAEFTPCIRSGVFAAKGNRPSMQDAHVVMDDAGQLVKVTSLPTSFYAVFDGHGGAHAAEFARDHLFPNFLKRLQDIQDKPDIALALTFAFIDTGNQFKAAWLENKGLASGTTALAAVIVGTELYVANAGDCRAVICRNGKALDMSVDHNPSTNMDENNRIHRAGGFLDKEGYLNEKINMSRGIGNWHLEGLKHPGPFICMPEIQFEHLTEEDEFMIVASDGLFHDCSSQHAVDFVQCERKAQTDLEDCARYIAEDTWHHQWRKNTLTDNSTVVIVSFLKEVVPSA